MLLDLPATAKSVLLNIGSNRDPILPPANDTSVVAVAFEPMVPELIEPHERLFVVPAAVSAEPGIASMARTGGNSTAASLAPMADKKLQRWLTKNIFGKSVGEGSTEVTGPKRTPPATKTSGMRIVPIVAMSALLGSLRDDLDLWYLKTDMQGFDYTGALHAAGSGIGRFHYVASEVHLLGVEAYAGVSNDYCARTLPWMLSHGFEPYALLTFWSLSPAERTALRDSRLPRGRKTHEFPYLFHGGVPTLGHTRRLSGAHAAHAYCKREAEYLASTNETTKPTGTREANAFFRRVGTRLPPPPVSIGVEDWPFMRAELTEAGTIKLT